MSYKLSKPLSINERADFIVEYNHTKGLRIEETDTALYALEPFEKLVNDEIVDNTQEYQAEQAQKERARLNMLSLTAADVERAIYQAKGIDFEDVIEMVSQSVDTPSQPSPLGEGVPSIDVKALKIELKANNFYRGNPYVNTIGNLLGFTSADLDYLFKHKKFPLEVTDDGMVL